ncbi:hypothetical protein [Algicola sagamiensis]|uniref:hypothetical protein n=1 Tax=Algicola sagamiensis TaxID=163869 RepID=UPI000360134A|nr:hypothetical protein [Algicola sagamiensis]
MELKPYATFFVAYFVLTMLSVVINQTFNIHPEIGLNIAAIIIAVYFVFKFCKLQLSSRKKMFQFSAIGGSFAVIMLLLLGAVFDGYAYPSPIESTVSFIFNSIVVYIISKLIKEQPIQKT